MNRTEQLYQHFLQHPVVTTDSRDVPQNSLFFALKGDNFNGNKFAKAALEQGAAYAIIDEAQYQLDERYILVENVLSSLQQLATHHRRQFKIPILAITGTNGKTTTKELVSTVLKSQYQAHFTQGNFNNHIGVPLTLLKMPFDTKVAIIEMGANHVGEIDFLCRIAEPTHGIITNIGKAHLEGFGSLEGVKQAKSELYRYLAETKGVGFINMDEPYLQALAKPLNKKIPYLKSDKPDPEVAPFEVKFLDANPFVEVAFLDRAGEMITVKTNLIGAYNFANIMTAVAVGKYFKVPAFKIKEAIESYQPKNMRSQIVKQGSMTYILDAYNANPTSMHLALQNFHQLKASSKIVILGDMLELGKDSISEHQKIVNDLQQYEFDNVILVGKEFSRTEQNTSFRLYATIDELSKWWWQQDFSKSFVLIKGSRGIKLEKLLEAVEQA